ncbi:MAG: hypothetical protein ACR2PF_16965 [Rhizobiaceae bacterium]
MTELSHASSIVQQRSRDVKLSQARANSIPLEAGQGYPVPVEIDGAMWLAFPFFLSRGRPPNKPRLSPFGWIVWVDVTSGEAINLKKLESDLSSDLGERQLDPSIDLRQFRELEKKLHRSMSQLLGIASNLGRQLTIEEQQAAEAYRDAWGKIAHKPLMEQYYALNPQWFDALGIKP